MSLATLFRSFRPRQLLSIGLIGFPFFFFFTRDFSGPRFALLRRFAAHGHFIFPLTGQGLQLWLAGDVAALSGDNYRRGPAGSGTYGAEDVLKPMGTLATLAVRLQNGPQPPDILNRLFPTIGADRSGTHHRALPGATHWPGPQKNAFTRRKPSRIFFTAQTPLRWRAQFWIMHPTRCYNFGIFTQRAEHSANEGLASAPRSPHGLVEKAPGFIGSFRFTMRNQAPTVGAARLFPTLLQERGDGWFTSHTVFVGKTRITFSTSL